MVNKTSSCITLSEKNNLKLTRSKLNNHVLHPADRFPCHEYSPCSITAPGLSLLPFPSARLSPRTASGNIPASLGRDSGGSSVSLSRGHPRFLPREPPLSPHGSNPHLSYKEQTSTSQGLAAQPPCHWPSPSALCSSPACTCPRRQNCC